MRDHHLPAGEHGHRRCFDGLCDGTDLKSFEKQCVAGLDIKCQEIVADDPRAVANRCLGLRVGLPIVLVEEILDGDQDMATSVPIFTL